MRNIDLLRLSLGALSQYKERTTLTLSGVAVGALLLFFSVSGGQGVQLAIVRLYQQEDWLRVISVRPDTTNAIDVEATAEPLQVPGEMSEQRRERLRRILQRRLPTRPYRPTTPLDQSRLRQLAAMPHVESVVPNVVKVWQITWEHWSEGSSTFGVSSNDRHLEKLLLAGRLLSDDSAREVLVHEALVYDWGIVDERDVESVLGKQVRLESPKPARYDGQGQRLKMTRNQEDSDEHETDPPRLEFVEDFTIVGVFRSGSLDERSTLQFGGSVSQASVLLPIETASELFLRVPRSQARGFQAAIVIVDRNEHVRQVVEAITATGLQQRSLVKFLDRVLANTALITWSLSGFATVALLVAGIGITNTMWHAPLACSPFPDPDAMRVSTARMGKETFDGKEKEAARP